MSRYECEGKKRFPSMREAESSARNIRRYGWDKEVFRAYACRHCGGFHLGHGERSVNQGRRKGSR